MPFGGNDWLALTQEPTLEPDLPICDPHHHFWDLRPGSMPYQRFLLHELIGDIGSGHNVRGPIFNNSRRTRGWYRGLGSKGPRGFNAGAAPQLQTEGSLLNFGCCRDPPPVV